jgi:hypothetical protein
MDTITDVKSLGLQKDGGSDVTSYDASVKLSDTGWGRSMRHCRSVDVRTQSQEEK